MLVGRRTDEPIPTVEYSCDNCEANFVVKEADGLERLRFQISEGFEVRFDYCPVCFAVVKSVAAARARKILEGWRAGAGELHFGEVLAIHPARPSSEPTEDELERLRRLPGSLPTMNEEKS